MHRFIVLLSAVAVVLLTSVVAGARLPATAQEVSPAPAPVASAGPAMGTEVAWLVELSVHTGALETVQALMAEMVTSARGEAGNLGYAWYVSADVRTVAMYERYADDAAVLAHQAKFAARFAERFLGAMTPTRYTVFGAPGEAVGAAWRDFDPIYLQPFGGFPVR